MALVASAIAARRPDLDLLAATLVTSGARFTSRGIPIVASGPEPPSGGFPTTSVAGLLRDLPVVPACLHYLRQIRRHARADDVAVVGGDTFLLGLARIAFRKPAVHLALAKSVHGQPHTRFEHALLRRWASLVLARDEATAAALGSHHVRAEFFGNPLVDYDIDSLLRSRAARTDSGSPPSSRCCLAVVPKRRPIWCDCWRSVRSWQNRRDRSAPGLTRSPRNAASTRRGRPAGRSSARA